MKDVDLGFKARDLHELACHAVAESAGLYTRRGLAVTLRDTRSVPDDELPDSWFSVACGAAAIRWLRGENLKVVFAATTRPMFWLYSHDSIKDIRQLRGSRIATYPVAAPPAQLLRIVLEDGGLKPARDVILQAVPEEASRIAMLRSGDAAAALVGSSVSPRRMEEAGFWQLFCVGDRFRLPTTGLAVSLAAFENERDKVDGMRDCLRASLRLIHTETDALEQALRTAKLVQEADLGQAVELAGKHFTTDGLVDAEEVLPGLRRLAGSLGVPVPRDPASLYDPVYRPR